MKSRFIEFGRVSYELHSGPELFALRRHAITTVVTTVVITAAFSLVTTLANAGEVIRNSIAKASSDHRVSLGRVLFLDPRLSGDGKVSCATCHNPDKAFADGLPLARGIGGQLGTRNTPSLFNVGLLPNLTWDGRQPSLEGQAVDPLMNPVEHGIASPSLLLKTIRSDANYRSAFQAAFQIKPSGIKIEHVGVALAAFQRTLLVFDAPFDRYVASEGKEAMAPAAMRGLELFRGRADCIACHTVQSTRANFSDGQFHSLGIGTKGASSNLSDMAAKVINDMRGVETLRLVSDPQFAELGRFNVTRRISDIAKFRTPGLRNVALTAPYMHDGSIPTLSAAVDYEVNYRRRESAGVMALTKDEQDDLVEFLKALTSSEQARRRGGNLQ